MLRSSFITLVFASSLVNAELPYTFISGSKAKASEVNSNFSYLENRITELASSLPNPVEEPIEEPPEESNPEIEYECSTTNYDFVYNYEPVDVPLGTSVYIEDYEYKTAKYSITASNGDIYHITKPMRVHTQTSPTETTYVISSVYSSDIDTAYICEDSQVFGDGKYIFSINNGISLTRTYSYSNDGDNDTSQFYDTYLQEKIRYSASVAVGDKRISFVASVEVGVFEELVAEGDYDFTDNIPTNNNPDYTVALNQLRDFLNHIKIEKITE